MEHVGQRAAVVHATFIDLARGRGAVGGAGEGVRADAEAVDCTPRRRPHTRVQRQPALRRGAADRRRRARPCSGRARCEEREAAPGAAVGVAVASNNRCAARVEGCARAGASNVAPATHGACRERNATCGVASCCAQHTRCCALHTPCTQHAVLQRATRRVATCNARCCNVQPDNRQPAPIRATTCSNLNCNLQRVVMQDATCRCRVQHDVLQVATSNTPHPTCDIDHAACNMLCCTPCCNVHHAVLQHSAVCTACSMLRATRSKCGVDNPACNEHHVVRAAATAHRACTRAAPPRAARSARPARR